MNMKILVCTGIYPPDIGGPATYSKLLFEELPKKGIEVKVLSFGEVRHLPKLIRHYIYYLKVKKAGENADLIFAQDPVSVGLPVALASKKINKKFVLKVVGDYAWEQFQQSDLPAQTGEAKNRDFISPEDFWGRKFKFKTETRKKIQKFVAEKAEKIVVPSEYLKKIVNGWGINNKKIQVINNAFTPTEIIDEKYHLRTRFKISGNTIFSVGRLVPWKGFEMLMDVVKSLPEEYRLLIAGDGPDEEKLRLKIKEMNLGDRIKLLGRLDRDDLLMQIKASDIFVLNTGYEGLSHQLLEVMSVGTPIITTNVGGNPEVLRDGKDGLLVRYNDKKALRDSILKFAGNRVMADRLANSAKERVEMFDREKMLEEISSLLLQYK